MRALGGALIAMFLLVSSALAGPSDPDPGFGSGGVVREPFLTPSAFEDVVVQSDGKVVAVGSADDARGAPHIAVARREANGAPDTTFAGDGRLSSALAGSAAVDAGIMSDGRIVVVGTHRISGTSKDQIVVERYTAAGSLDPTFNPGGSVPGRFTVQAPNEADTDPEAALIAPDGTVTVAGTTFALSGLSGFVARVTPAGALDARFGSSGFRLIRVADQTTRLTSVAGNASGRIAVAGEVRFPGAVTVELAVARLTPGGALDATFNPSGPAPGTAYQTIDTGGDGRDSSSAGAVAIDAAGAITAAGHAEQNASTPRAALARFTAGGVTDQAFGTGGFVKDLSIGEITDAASWDALEVDAAGALTVAGYGFTGGVKSVLAARYTTSGAADMTFNGTQFFRRYAPGTGAIDFAKGIVRTADNALILAGVTTTSSAAGPRPAGLLLRIGGQNVQPGVPPTAGFVVSHPGTKAIRPGEVVTFTSTATDDGSVARDDWDLSGGPDLESTGSVVTHAYPEPGKVTVSHRVTDDQGLTASSSQTIEIVANETPTPLFGTKTSTPGVIFAPGPARADRPYVLHADGSFDPDGTIQRYRWDMDGTGGFEVDTGTTGKVTHTFPQSGLARVRVEVTDDEGATAVAEADIKVLPTPDFALRVFENSTPLDTITIVRGKSELPSLVIERIDGSTGPVSMSAQAPPGVTVQFLSDALDRLKMNVSVAPAVAVGTYPLTIRGVPADADAGSAPRTVAVQLRVVEAYDVRVAGMEVTQGAQGGADSGDPYLNPGPNHDKDPLVWPADRTKRLDALQRLVHGPRTIVRVFATTAGGTPVKGVTGVLYGFIAGTDAKLGAVASDQKSMTVAPGPAVATPDIARTAPGRLTFTLPNNWTLHDMDLRVVLTTPQKTLAAGNSEQCKTAACANNDTFQIDEIPIADAPTLTFQALELRVDGAKLPSADKVFDQTRALLPLGGSHFDLRPYAAVLDISDVAAYDADDFKAEFGYAPKSDGLSNARNNKVLNRVDQWTDTNTPALLKAGVDSVIGVNASQDVARGVSSGTVEYARKETKEGRPWIPRAVVAADRLITSVAHEIGHQIGREHADTACGGKGDVFGTGMIEDDGIDRRPGSDGAGGYQLVYPGYKPVADADPLLPPGGLYDYMSYCAAISGDDSWIGSVGWQKYMKIFDRLAEQETSPGTGAAGRAAVTGQLAVSGYVDTDGNAVVTSVRPASKPAPSGRPAPFALVTSDGSGAPGGAVPLSTRLVHIDEPDAPVEMQIFDARVPAGTRTVDLVDDAGRTLSSRSATLTAPKVDLLTQTRPKRIAGRGTTVVRARVIDTDPSALPLSVDLLLDDRILRSTTVRPGVVTFKLTNRELPRARRARLVVRVNDGWNQSEARSAALRMEGGPPLVSIRGLSPNAAVDPNRTLVLEGTAYDSTGRRIGGRGLKWFVGRRLVGTGMDVAVAGLPAGRRMIKLSARDRDGRTSTARLPVRVRAGGPQVVELSTPQKLGRRARVLPVRVATVLPATLRVGGRRFKVGSVARTVKIPVRPGAAPLRVRGTLVGAAGRRRVTLAVAR